MRKNSFMFGLLTGACIFGSITVLANTDVLAQLTSQVFYMNGNKIELEAYSINDYNYVRLRDAARIFGVNIEYDEKTDSVYLGEKPVVSVPVTPVTRIDGTAYAREDFSQQANPAIFDSVYTRDAYNAMRQSIVDIDIITAGIDEKGFNPNYRYAHFVDNENTFNQQGKTTAAMNSVGAHLFGYYNFSLGQEPTIENIYEYPGYWISTPQIHKFFEPANKATEGFVNILANLSDVEKVKRIADLVSDKIVYKDEDVVGVNQVFTSTAPVNGICGTYSKAFIYLCQQANIPCVSVQDDVHAWNEVYVNGKWYIADIGSYDIARTDDTLLRLNYLRQDENVARTNFAKELLVPGSTK